MMTRKATSKDMEMKLKQSLTDLAASRDLCDRLTQEREESEQEIVKILDTNKGLKHELAELHVKYIDLQEQCNVLQETVNTLDACSSTHEQALSRINFLEISLSEAHSNMKQLQSQLNDGNMDSHSQSLFSELTECNSDFIIESLIKNVKSGHSTNQMNVCSIKKLKKYIRISRFINKSRKLLKQQNHIVKHMQLRKERRQLVDKLRHLKSCADSNIKNYNSFSTDLELKIVHLEQTLKTMFKNIQSMSQRQLNYQIHNTNDMEDMCNYNAERFESLNMKRSCKCPIDMSCHRDGQAGGPVTEFQSDNVDLTCSLRNTSEYSALLTDTQLTSSEQKPLDSTNTVMNK
jgi:hypothetical protein